MGRLAAALVMGLLVLSFLSVFAPMANGTSCPSCLTPPSQAQLDAAIAYFTSKYNPEVQMIAVGTQTDCSGPCGGVQFWYMDNGTGGVSDPCPTQPTYYRVLPFENWMDAAALAGMGVHHNLTQTIFNRMEDLKTQVGWQPKQGREATIGYLGAYDIPNENVCMTLNHTGPLPTYGSHQYQIAGAERWNFSDQSWIPTDTSVQKQNAAKTGDLSQFDNRLWKAFNFWIRGDPTDARAILQAEADTCAALGDGSVGFGGQGAPYRGMWLGVFLEAVEVMGEPTLPNGCTMDGVINTLWGIQQPDGGFARNYDNLTSMAGADDETTNAALLAYSPGIIQKVIDLDMSGTYDLFTVPSTDPVVDPFFSEGVTTTTSSTAQSTRTGSHTITQTHGTASLDPPVSCTPIDQVTSGVSSTFEVVGLVMVAGAIVFAMGAFYGMGRSKGSDVQMLTYVGLTAVVVLGGFLSVYLAGTVQTLAGC